MHDIAIAVKVIDLFSSLISLGDIIGIVFGQLFKILGSMSIEITKMVKKTSSYFLLLKL